MTTLSQKQSPLLQNALRGNGIFSGISGVLAIVLSSWLTTFMSTGTDLFFIVMGAGLVLHAVTLFYNARTDDINPSFAWYAIAGDVIWVVATVIILLTDAFTLSGDGKWLLLFIGDIVLVFAIAQYIGLRRQMRA